MRDVTSNYRALGYAIVAQAIEDYKEYKQILKDYQELASKRDLTKEELDKAKEAMDEIMECELFFKSDWFNELVEYKFNGDELLEMLKRNKVPDVKINKP